MDRFLTIIFTLLSLVIVRISTRSPADVEDADERNVQAEKETIQLFENLQKNYDSRIRPYYGIMEDFTINTYLTQEWTDPRLRYNESLKLPPTSHYVDAFWLPDLIFIHAKDGHLHDVTVENRVVDIYPNGTVFLIQRLRLKLACAMDFTYFPLDHQTCAVDMESFEYSTTDLVFDFHQELPVFLFQEHSKIPQFSVKGANYGNCSKMLRIGKVSCVRVEFVFYRDVGYYLLHAYVPSFMLVFMAWVSFWIDVQSAPARVTLGITTILSMLTTSNGIGRDLPPVSYIKSINVWFLMCFVFVIGALAEFAVVHSISRNKFYVNFTKKSRRHQISNAKPPEENSAGRNFQSEDENSISALLTNRHRRVTFEVEMSEQKSENPVPSEYSLGDTNNQPQNHQINDISQEQSERSRRAKEIDRIACVAYPLLFVIFAGCYLILFVPEEEKTDLTLEDLENVFKWD